MIGGIAMNDDASSSRRNLLLGVGGAGLLAAGLAASSPRTATQGTDALTTQDISLAQAQAIVEAAIAASHDKGLAMDIAVLDAGANLKAFARMDGAWLGSIDIAIKKARTARFFNFPTGAIGELSQPGGPLYQIEVSNGGLITFPGGIPLMAADGTVIGAVGVSGSTVEDDHAVGTAGAAALGGLNMATPTS
jgi:uncharacterized protein GlcG (DUF336 family)